MECMLHDKKKRIIAICCSAFHIIILFPRLCPRLVALIQNFEHIAINHLITTLLPIVTPILALVFFLTYKKEYRLKRWLLPLAFGTAAIHSVVSLLSSSSSIIDVLVYEPKYILPYLCAFLTVIALILTVIGTLSVRHICLLKIGALGYAIITFATIIINFILAGGFVYWQSLPTDISPINVEALLSALSNILFYMSFYILSANKRSLE